jgi:ribosomal protein L24E
MTTFLEPRTGFKWSAVNWGGPDELRTEHCSYCGDALDREHSVPLILSRRDGSVAEFCDHCQSDMVGRDKVEPRHEPEVKR